MGPKQKFGGGGTVGVPSGKNRQGVGYSDIISD